MGTKVQYKTCFGGYNLMRDLNDDVNGNSWPIFYEEKNIPNYTGFIPRTAAGVYPDSDKNALKQKMLEHEAIFKNQVHELHRLYRIQKDMMEEIHTKEHCRHRGSIEPSASSSIQGSQLAADDVRKWHHRSYPLGDSCYPRSNVSGSENVNSPLSYKTGNNTLASQVASQNGFPKEFEASEARPFKVRKKLFDLQLPADEYVDSEDDDKLDNSPYSPRKECKTATESSMKHTVGDVKMCGLKEGFSSVSHSKRSTGLADLNEPIDVEEVTESSTANIFAHSNCNGREKDVHLPTKPNSGFLCSPKEARQKSIHGNKMTSLNTMSTENKTNGRDWFSYPYEADHCKEDSRKERLGRGLAAPHRSLNYSNHHNLEPVMASQVSNPFTFMNSSNDAGTWPQLMQSLGKPADSLKPNLTSFHTHPSLGSSSSLNKTLQSSVFSNHISGDKYHFSSSFRSNPCLSSDLPSHNGVYQGSSSGSKDLPGCFSSIGFNHLTGNRSDNTASVHVRNRMEKAFTSSSFVDIKPLKDMNLNATFPKKALEELVKVQDLDSADGNCKPGDHYISLPWLRTKPTFNDDATNSRREVIYIDASPPRASRSVFSGKSKAVIDLNQVYSDTSDSNNHTRSKNETNPIPSVKNILGVPIFEKLVVSESRVSPFVSSTTEAENAKYERKNRLIDINVACDASLLESEEQKETNEVVEENQVDKSSSARNFIDLNTWVAEDEDPPVQAVASISVPKKVVVEFNLEASPVPEEDDDFLPEINIEQEQYITPHPPDDDTEQAENEAIKSAAEAIVNISSCQHMKQENATCSPSDTAEEEILLWFANVASTTPMSGKEGSYKVMDDFEATILHLPETKEEEFMPKPFVPEVQKVEETGMTSLPGRPRRGQARRGRQRRDFQRDILPGLVSLSRHELTEDLQTFGGLMKAMGHSWDSGLTRRNGGRNKSGRGRRRKVVEAAPAACTQLMQQMDNVEASLEDRSLTSWGKTTRRPRRQRCPVSTAPIVAST